jgi:anti-sigma regulatory factor (Ser/Thr protein kinase)
MSDGFTLSLPADARYRGLASEIARKYAEYAGGTPADATALSEAVAGAVERAAGEAADGDIQLAFRADPSGVDVTLHWAGRSSELRHPLPARKP